MKAVKCGAEKSGNSFEKKIIVVKCRKFQYLGVDVRSCVLPFVRFGKSWHNSSYYHALLLEIRM